MLKGNFTCKQFFLSYICNLNFFINVQCKFLTIFEYGLTF